MRDRLPTSRETILRLETEVADLKRRVEGTFTPEEMDAIREQLAERAMLAEKARDDADQMREELEWNVRVELARVREAEATASRAATEMRRVAMSLAGLLGDEEPTVLAVHGNGRRRLFA